MDGFATAAVWITLSLLIVRMIKPSLRVPLRPWTVAAIVSSLLIFTGAKLAISQSASPQTAIVVVTDATVRNSPFDESPAAFTAHDGAELRVLDPQGRLAASHRWQSQPWLGQARGGGIGRTLVTGAGAGRFALPGSSVLPASGCLNWARGYFCS